MSVVVCCAFVLLSLPKYAVIGSALGNIVRAFLKILAWHPIRQRVTYVTCSSGD
jgi:hypothetical protein